MKSSRLISGLLYDGILSPQAWYAGLEAFKEAVGCMNFHQLTVDMQQGAVLESICSAIDAKGVENYERHYALVDERVTPMMRLGQGQMMLDHEHFNARHISRSALYADCLAPMGMKHTMGVMLRVEGHVHQYVGFMRHLDRPHFSDAERKFALRLMSDATRAARLRDRAAQLARHAALGLAALDTLPQGIAVVDAQCRIQYSNPAADRLLVRADVLRVHHGRLQCRDALAHAQLEQRIARACGCYGPVAAGAQDLAGSYGRLVVTVLPLKASHAAAVHWQEPMALVVLADPAAQGGIDPRLIGDMLGLSPAEARLALVLASGKSVKDFAAIQGCTWNTARSHLTHLLRKTGCHRQVELVQMLHALQGG